MADAGGGWRSPLPALAFALVMAWAGPASSDGARLLQPPDAVERALRSIVALTSAQGASATVGSAIVVAPGVILTADHVAEFGPPVQVVDGDRIRPARSLARDPATDLHLLRVEGLRRPAIELDAATAEPRAKHGWLAARGAPGQPLRRTAIATGGHRIPRLLPGTDLIGLGVGLESGDSGGALLDRAGRLLGLLLATRRGDKRPRSVAVPRADIRALLARVRRGRAPQRGWLGLALEPSAADNAGWTITSVAADSPAERAALEPGMVVHRLNGEPVIDRFRFAARLARREPGTSVRLVIGDEGRRRTRRITLATLPQPVPPAERR